MAYCYCLSIRMKRIISSSHFELFFHSRKGSISTVLFDSVNRGWKCTPEVMFNLLGSGTSSLCLLNYMSLARNNSNSRETFVTGYLLVLTLTSTRFTAITTQLVLHFFLREPQLLILYGSSSDNFHLAEEQMLVNALTDFFVHHD